MCHASRADDRCAGGGVIRSDELRPVNHRPAGISDESSSRLGHRLRALLEHTDRGDEIVAPRAEVGG